MIGLGILGQLGADGGFVADHHDAGDVFELEGSLHRAVHDLVRRMVATHHIEGNSDRKSVV